jgi:phytanoyl-CoA hydroxylase
VGKSREESHALKTELSDTDVVVEVPIKRGDITVHNERVVHGSGGPLLSHTLMC